MAGRGREACPIRQGLRQLLRRPDRELRGVSPGRGRPLEAWAAAQRDFVRIPALLAPESGAAYTREQGTISIK